VDYMSTVNSAGVAVDYGVGMPRMMGTGDLSLASPISVGGGGGGLEGRLR